MLEYQVSLPTCKAGQPIGMVVWATFKRREDAVQWVKNQPNAKITKVKP